MGKQNVRKKINGKQLTSRGTPEWQDHPYRSLVERLPVWISILTLFIIAVIFLNSWLGGFFFTVVIIIIVALLFDLLHKLHIHLNVHENQKQYLDERFSHIGRIVLTSFATVFLALFILFAFGGNAETSALVILGSIFSFIGLAFCGLSMLGYLLCIPALGLPRIRHQLSLMALLFFAYFYLFFAFAVKRISL